MDTPQYPPPLDQVLLLGEPEIDDWSSPQSMGLTDAHIPDLISMLQDPALGWNAKDPLCWAPVYAWRLLGMLKAEAAIQPLLGRLQLLADHHDEWAIEELPDVFGMIGAAAIEPLSDYLADPSHGEWPCIIASDALSKIGELNPDQRDLAVAGLTKALQNFAENLEIVNAYIVGELAELQAVEAVDLVQRAYEAGRVDHSVMGDFEEYQIAVGLLEERLTPVPPDGFLGPSFVKGLDLWSDVQIPSSGRGKATKKEKSKRKQAKQSRQKNRKKKR